MNLDWHRYINLFELIAGVLPLALLPIWVWLAKKWKSRQDDAADVQSKTLAELVKRTGKDGTVYWAEVRLANEREQDNAQFPRAASASVSSASEKWQLVSDLVNSYHEQALSQAKVQFW